MESVEIDDLDTAAESLVLVLVVDVIELAALVWCENL